MSRASGSTASTRTKPRWSPRRASGWAQINSVRLFGPDDAAGIVSFAVEGVHPHDVATILDEGQVAIRAGHHCAQPLMDALGVPATARASFGVYNSLADVEALARGSRTSNEDLRMNEESKIAVEEVDVVEAPPKARVEVETRRDVRAQARLSRGLPRARSPRPIRPAARAARCSSR